MRTMRTWEEVDEFDVTCGELTVSDPCYKRGTWCMGILPNVRNGVWHASVARDDGEIAALLAYTGREPSDFDAWERCEFVVGVDSGQAGIFDSNHYRRDFDAKGYRHEQKPICADEPWYSMCCDKTMGEGEVGVVPGGVVASSGGDGRNHALVLKNAEGKVVAVQIVFDGDKDEDDC